ncbi:hypothetical protein ACHAXT_005896 [Thalassiosira profunda]
MCQKEVQTQSKKGPLDSGEAREMGLTAGVGAMPQLQRLLDFRCLPAQDSPPLGKPCLPTQTSRPWTLYLNDFNLLCRTTPPRRPTTRAWPWSTCLQYGEQGAARDGSTKLSDVK